MTANHAFRSFLILAACGLAGASGCASLGTPPTGNPLCCPQAPAQ